MKREESESILNDLVDALASIEHARWSHWQRYVHEHASKQPDGSLLMPSELVGRWERQIATSFEALSEREKESDREQVRKYLPIIAAAFSSKPSRDGSDD